MVNKYMLDKINSRGAGGGGTSMSGEVSIHH